MTGAHRGLLFIHFSNLSFHFQFQKYKNNRLRWASVILDLLWGYGIRYGLRNEVKYIISDRFGHFQSKFYEGELCWKQWKLRLKKFKIMFEAFALLRIPLNFVEIESISFELFYLARAPGPSPRTGGLPSGPFPKRGERKGYPGAFFVSKKNHVCLSYFWIKLSVFIEVSLA